MIYWSMFMGKYLALKNMIYMYLQIIDKLFIKIILKWYVRILAGITKKTRFSKNLGLG